MNNATWSNCNTSQEQALTLEELQALASEFKKPRATKIRCGRKAHLLIEDTFVKDALERTGVPFPLGGPQVILEPMLPTEMCVIFDQFDQIMKIIVISDKKLENNDLLGEIEAAVVERPGIPGRVEADAAQSAHRPDDEAGAGPLRLESAPTSPADGRELRED